ncbi:MAG TPA: Asp-tRNA(Asn)/Glu-tRNA(Gln) amidotransferase subunit GatB [Candidatus Paceibacterota bacterium]|nr:Asp-tRNA(Asn)/Glu-tRNA(Gln) amidotransferase subunit GatB [Candidatus Paceibacterota bacterium]
MASYKATIGLEIHAELKTQTKMFCASKNDPDEPKPNVNICPVCLAHPGTLPVINAQAVRHVLRVGAALGAKLADYTEFDRKNYFYPDLPKGYQISQYEFPLVSGGTLAGVQITRVHLEEDTASSLHDENTGETLVDFNRAGLPLMELVTDPVIKTAEEAGIFARELQLLLRSLGASEANMEKGQMRVEANISVSKDDTLGTKVEVKNLNSFKAMERAVAYEIKRQSAMLEKGEAVAQETRGWDDAKQATFAQRIKEGSADYRYFPDPDLPSLKLSELKGYSLEEISAELPELPEARRTRYTGLGVKKDDASMYVRDARFGTFFEAAIAGYKTDTARIALASNYIANDLVKIIRDIEERDTENNGEIPISVQNFNSIISMAIDKKISSRGAKDLLALAAQDSRDPELLAKEKGLLQTLDAGALGRVVGEIISANPDSVAQYKAGKGPALEFLIGQGMKALKGGGDPQELRRMLMEAMQST